MNDRPIIAMVHYHLRRGGVTRVIRNAVEALERSPVRCVVLTGESLPEEVTVNAPVVVVEGLAYDEHGALPSPETLLERVRQGVRDAVGAEPDLWHIHNHALGKNAVWTRAVSRLADEGEALLLQIHDFAEDGRPANYRYLTERFDSPDQHELGRILYPQAARTQYALLNSRDYRMMRRAGVSESRAHLLPNAVWTGPKDEEPNDQRNADQPLLLYPSRAIRRKNIGEFLLWSAREEGGGRYGITLAPQSPNEMPFYNPWKSFASEQRLPVLFEMGLTHEFHKLLASASALVTTSIAEGFGLAFLEPWLAGRPLVGRDLPEITSEFVDEGIDLHGLYTELTVPLDWIDQDDFRSRVRDALQQVGQAYGRTYTEEDTEEAVHAAISGDRIEFSRLDESLQQTVIAKVRASRAAGAEVIPDRLMPERDIDRQLLSNRKRVQVQFGLEQYRERLMSAYSAVMDGGDTSPPLLPAGAVLDQWLAPGRFYLLRS